MGKTTASKLNNSKAIFYYDRINYTEVAATIIEHLYENLSNEQVLGEALCGGEVSVEDFSQVLETMFDLTALEELVNTPFGRGILFGMYLRIIAERMASSEQEVLDEMDL